MMNQFFKLTVFAASMFAMLGFQAAAEAKPHTELMINTPIVIGHRGTAGLSSGTYHRRLYPGY